MIKGFACKHTEALFHGTGCDRKFRAFQEQAERKLQMLHSAERVEDLRSPPGNKLETLGGDLGGKWSLRINKKQRLVFEWDEQSGNAKEVYIDDYH